MTVTTFNPSADQVATGFGAAIETQAAVAPGRHAAPEESHELVELPGVGGIDLVVGEKSSAPQLSQAADGTYHLTLTWTKATKAHVGTAVAAIIGIGEIATEYVLPEGPYKVWAQSALAAVGLVGVWLGVYLPTNKARKA